MKLRNKTYQYQWVDDFIKDIKPYVSVRTEDNLLIKRPNNATKLNDTGAQILKYLLNGGNIKNLLKQAGEDKTNDILNFIIGVKDYLKGDLDEFSCNPAVNKEPFEMKFSSFPVLSELAITYKCNLKCQFCYAGCNCTANPCGSDAELSLEELKTIVSKIYYDAKVPSISFTGGEPTLRKNDLMELIQYAKKLEMRVNLITNGTLIDKEYARQLEKAGLDSVQVSLEGMSEQTNDKLVGIQGAYKKTRQAVRFLKDTSIHTHTNTTITLKNLKECPEFPEFVKKELELDKFSMNLIIPTGSGIVYKDLIVGYQDIGKTLKKIIENSNTHKVEFMWYSPVPMCMFNSILHGLGNKGCSACDGLISIAPNGDILPCASFNDPVGNILQNPFNEIWQNNKCIAYRNKELAHNFCKKCEHFHICNGACPLYWRECGYNELEKIIQKN